jgi:phage tail-like protein
MAQFSVNTHRKDPYKNFKFRVMWEGRFIAGVSKVSPLRRSTETVGFRDGGGISRPLISPGKTEYDPITLERGITHDTAFEEWANQIYNTSGDGAVSLKNLRKDIRIELYNLSGQLVIAYNIFRCWVSEYQALPELDATGEASTAFERIVLQHEGWERDKEVKEPEEN